MVAVGVLAVVLTGKRPEPADSPAPKPVEPAAKVAPPTVESVISEHLADNPRAQSKFKGALLAVKGVVHSTDWHTRKHEGVLVMVEKVGGKHIVMATFKPPHEDAALSLPVKSEVTLKGQYVTGTVLGGQTVTLMLTSCELAR